MSDGNTASRRNNAASGAAQQIVAPVDGGPERLLSRQRRAAATGQDRETVTQPLEQLIEADCPQPDGRQLECQWHAVEATTEVEQQLTGGVRVLELDAGVCRPSHQQGDRLGVCRALPRSRRSILPAA